MGGAGFNGVGHRLFAVGATLVVARLGRVMHIRPQNPPWGSVSALTWPPAPFSLRERARKEPVAPWERGWGEGKGPPTAKKFNLHHTSWEGGHLHYTPGGHKGRPYKDSRSSDPLQVSLQMGCAGWMLRVFGPAGRVVHDVLTDPVQVRLVADDMFIIIPLP